MRKLGNSFLNVSFSSSSSEVSGSSSLTFAQDPILLNLARCWYTVSHARRPSVTVARTYRKRYPLEWTCVPGRPYGQRVDEDTTKKIEQFTAVMYGAKTGTDLNDYRFRVVEKTYTTKSRGQMPFHSLKTIDGGSIPPCASEIAPHIARANFIAVMWANADSNNIKKTPEREDGWDVTDGGYGVIWFLGDQLPPSLIPAIPDEGDSDEESDDDMRIVSSDESDDDNY